MEEGKKLYIKMLQKTMEEDLSLLEPEQQYNYIEKSCNKLVLLLDKDINKNIEKFFNDLEKLEEEFKKQYTKYIDTKADMCKEMYEEIKKL